jgi:AraC family transcriptional regulator
MREQSVIAVRPDDIARRQQASWGGVTAEIVQVTRRLPYEYAYHGTCHLLIASLRGERVAGETRVDGLPTSKRHEFTGTMCFVPVGSRFRGASVPRILTRTLNVYLDPAAIVADTELRFGEIDFSPRLFFEDPALHATALKLGGLIDEGVAAGRLYAETLSHLLAIELVQLERGASSAWPAHQGGLAAWQLRTVRDYIDEHLDKDITLGELAALARLSATYFCRAFKKSLGLPPHRYQAEQRVDRAKALLAISDRSVAEIAIACGFNSAGNFATAFRRMTGRTPTDYRRSLL